MAGEDFSFFSQQVSSAFVFLGGRNESAGTGASLHNPGFTLDESILPLGAAYHVELAKGYFRLAQSVKYAEQLREARTEEL